MDLNLNKSQVKPIITQYLEIYKGNKVIDKDCLKESFVYGKPEDDGDYKICCKIVYDKDLAKNHYKTNNEQEIKEALWQEVKKVNKTVPAYKYIREISVTQKELIKTTTQKIKRFEEIKTVVD